MHSANLNFRLSLKCQDQVEKVSKKGTLNQMTGQFRLQSIWNQPINLMLWLAEDQKKIVLIMMLVVMKK